MDTKDLKKYAPQARTDFIEAVAGKAALYGLLPKEIVPLNEQGDTVIIGDHAFPKAIARKRADLEQKINDTVYDQFIESIAYTWFNRLVAIRYMEVHGYIDHGYRVLSHPQGKPTPEILDNADRLDLPGLDSDHVIELKLDGNKDEELYRLILIAQCNALNRLMPFMFGATDDATELLLPDNLLHTESLIRKLVTCLPEESLQSVESIGWLYQFYISEKKDDVFAALKKGKKITPENIPAATQLFTPHWIVRYLVENSLGRLWMLNHPDSRLIEQMDYYIRPEEPETDFLQISSVEEIKICDPACGSGHMLTYAFDLLYAIYEEQGYQATDIPRLIVTRNLYGIEIDQRAGSLAAFALTMKAREKYRRFLTSDKVVQPNICVLENIKFDNDELSSYMEQVGSDLFTQQLEDTLNQWEEADNFGSLIRPQVGRVRGVLELLRERQMGDDLFLAGVHQKVLTALRQADYLSPKYHVVVANPPYMGSRGMNKGLSDWAKKEYDDSRADFFSMFMERGVEFLMSCGYMGMINLPSWLFLSSYNALRNSLLSNVTIQSLLHMGRGIFGIDWGSVAFVIKNEHIATYKGDYFRLHERNFQHIYYEDIKQIFLNAKLSGPYRYDFNQYRDDSGTNEIPSESDSNGRLIRYKASTVDFEMIPGQPIAYWISGELRRAFELFPPLHSIATPRAGMITGNNEMFVRLAHEVSRNKLGLDCESREAAEKSGKTWFLYQKGGPFRKWFGNIEHVVDWENDGQRLRTTTNDKGKVSAHAFNDNYIFKPNVNWSAISSSHFSCRVTRKGCLFDASGSAAFPDNEQFTFKLAAFLNSTVARQLLNAINPTLNFQAWEIGSLCVDVQSDSSKTCQQLAEQLVESHKNDWDSYESSIDFQSSKIIGNAKLLSDHVKQLRLSYQASVDTALAQECELNRLLLNAYGISDSLPDVPESEITLNCNPKYRYGSDKSESELEAFLLADTMREFISYAAGCMLGRYSLDKPGLILANQGETADDYRKLVPEPTFAPDEDNVIPLLDGDWFTDDISERFKEFLKVTFGTEHFGENLTFLENALYPDNLNGKKRKTIQDYLLKEFHSHHLKMYKKRPIYWLFSSGKLKAFQCVIYMHRYNNGTLARMRTEYVVKLLGLFTSRIDQLESDIPAATSTSHRKKLEKERDTLTKQRTELQTFDEKLRHYADQRIEIDLDDGVKVNYGKFGDLLSDVKAVTGKKPVLDI